MTEVVLTALFVFAVLGATSRIANPATAGIVIGFSLTIVHLIGIPITGTSVNPARSLGPALVVGGTALSQVWLFIVAPLVGGAVAAGLHRVLYPEPPIEPLASGELPASESVLAFSVRVALAVRPSPRAGDLVRTTRGLGTYIVHCE